MNSLEKRIEKLESSQKAPAWSAFDCEKHALATMEALRKMIELEDSMTPEEFEAFQRERMANAPADSPLGRLRDLRAEREAHAGLQNNEGV